MLFLALLSPWQNGYIHFQALPPVFASYVRLRLRPLKYLRLRQVKPNGVNVLSVKHLLRVLPPVNSNQLETSRAKQKRTLTIREDRKSTRLNSSHVAISYAV